MEGMGIVNSLFWKFLERFFSQFLGFVIQIVLARLIEPAEFGVLAIVIAVINIASIFIQNGISTFIVVKKEIDDLDLSTVMCSSMIISGVGYITLFFLSPLIERGYNLTNLAAYIRILSFVLFLYAFNAVYMGLLEREMKFKSLFLRSIIAVPISGGVGIWMAYSGYGIYALIVQTLLNQLFLCIVLCIGVKRFFAIRFSMKRAKEIYKFCIPIMIQWAVGDVVNMIKSLSISKLYSTEDLAYYDKGSSYSNYINQFVNAPIAHVLLPAFSKWQSDLEKLKQIYLVTLKLSNMISLPIIMGFAAISKNFIIFFLTSKWVFAVDFLIAFCIIRAINISINLNVQIFYVLKMSKMVMILNLIITVLSFAAFFISRAISPLAIVWGEIVVTVFLELCTLFLIKKYIGALIVEQIKCFLNPIIGVVLMSMIVYFIDRLITAPFWALIAQIMIGAGFYVLFSFFFQHKELVFLKEKVLESIRKI